MDDIVMTDAEIAECYHSGLDWVTTCLETIDEDTLQHIGNENSGRYRRGSGMRPFQHIGETARNLMGLGRKKEPPKEEPKKEESSSSSKPSASSSSSKSFRFDRSKKPKDMTDEELDEAIKELEAQLNRLNREKKVSDLQSAIKNYGKPTATPKEKKDASILKSGLKALTDMNGKALNNIGTQLITYGWGTFVNNLAGNPVVNPKKGQKDK